MLGSVALYGGVVLVVVGVVLVATPLRRFAGPVVAAGVVMVVLAAIVPPPTRRAVERLSRLDSLMPVWQFGEYHERTIAASPEDVFAAIDSVRAGEIWLFNTLTWIRRGGRELPESILNAGDTVPVIDVATRSGFVRLADEPPRETVLGTIIAAPRGQRAPLTAASFTNPVAAGHVLAAMNFLVTPDGENRSRVSTATRVLANSDGARRRFALYWRVIYPGSAFIRRMWLRAIERRARRAPLDR